MSRSERNLLVVLVLTAVVLWTAVGYNVMQTWQRPLGPQLALPTYTPVPVSQPSTATLPPTTGSTGTPFPSPKPSITPFVQDIDMPLCGGPMKMTLLAIGSDTRAPGYLYGLADVIRLVRVDFVVPRVSVLEFPRDLWVEIPEIDEHYKITHGKLNQAYLYGNPGYGYYQGQGQGPGLLARTLDLNFGARPDHYIAANMQTFVRMVDAIGGIDVYLPYDVDARKADQGGRYDLVFRQGAHHLNGQQALMLARIRTVDTFHRADQQNRVLCAVRDTLLDAYNLPKIPEIVGAFDGAIQTDLSPQQISQLACLVPKLEPKNISFITFPRELLKETRTYDIGVKKDVFIFEADFNAMRLYVNAFNAGIWPGPITPVSPAGTPLPPGEGGFSCQ
jgi:LCP family protein required for cell wall assembly